MKKNTHKTLNEEISRMKSLMGFSMEDNSHEKLSEEFINEATQIINEDITGPGVTNITITDNFLNLGNLAFNVVEGVESTYIWMSPGGQQGAPDETGGGNYVAFQNGVAVMGRYGNTVAIIGNDVSPLKGKGGQWVSEGQNSPTAYGVMHTTKGAGDSGVGPAVQKPAGGGGYTSLKTGSDINTAAARYLKVLLNTTGRIKISLSNFKIKKAGITLVDEGGKTINPEEGYKVLGLVSNVMKLAADNGIVSGEFDINRVATIAKA
jgi:hypothetical protein